MPTARDFEDAAVDYCLDSSGVGVWAVHLQQVDQTVYDITVRLGGRYRSETKGIAVVRVIYYPQQQSFICQPADSILPELAAIDDPTYLFN